MNSILDIRLFEIESICTYQLKFSDWAENVVENEKMLVTCSFSFSFNFLLTFLLIFL